MSFRRKLRVGLLSAWSSHTGGGVFEVLRTQAHQLEEYGVVKPIVIAGRDSSYDPVSLGKAERHLAASWGPKSFELAPRLSRRLLDADLDILHLHGIWMWPSVVGRGWAEKSGKPYVVSPHGMLAPWLLGRGKLKKRIALHAYEERNLRAATLVHALTSAEAVEIAAVVPSVPTVVVPNGVHLHASGHPPSLKHVGPVIYLGRIHPKKNIDTLVHAWTALGASGQRPRDAQLIIAGWGDPRDVANLQALVKTKADPTIKFLGPVFGDAKDTLLRTASFLVLPSFSEGLPMSVLEAWATGTPVIMSAECNLPEGFRAGAAIECGTSAHDLTVSLGLSLSIDLAKWKRMSASALKLVRSRYEVVHLASKWSDLYASLCRAGPSDPSRKR